MGAEIQIQDMQFQTRNKIKNFTDLDAWKEGHQLVLMVYKITKNFPKDELFGLTSQMRRAVVSITSNVAEGFGRYSYKEKAVFYSTAAASDVELQNQLIISRDIDYIKQKQFDEIYEKSVMVHKIINGLIKGARKIHDS
jgi:four helix bundle protein